MWRCRVKRSFDALRGMADNQLAAVVKGLPPNAHVGAEAITVAATLFNWIAMNVPEEEKRADIANKVSLALGLENT